MWKKTTSVWHFPWSLDHFRNLVRFSTKGCEDSHIKIPKDIPKYLEKERIFLGRLEGEKKAFYFLFFIGRPEGTT